MNLNSQAKSTYQLILGLILFGTITRLSIPPLLSHPVNFAPIDAIALFCGAYFNRRLTAYLVVLLTLFIGDLIINKMLTGVTSIFYPGFYWQYLAYFFITIIGSLMYNRVKPISVAIACLTSSVIFFIISNFGVWLGGLLYPVTFDGLIACYVAAIPFFKNTLLSDLLFSSILFGSYEWLKKYSLRNTSQYQNF